MVGKISGYSPSQALTGEELIEIIQRDASGNWKNRKHLLSDMKGEQGDIGTPGADGQSAYEVAVDNGFIGTEAEWLESLQGTDGQSAYDAAVEAGFTGTQEEWLTSLEGEQGIQGEVGISAYELAVQEGFGGTVTDWLNTLAGSSAYDVAVENGFVGTLSDWLDSLVGATGMSAYEVAVRDGFTGTDSEWLESLQGESPFDIASRQGFVGTEAEWLDTLVGDTGKSAYEVALDEGFIGSVEDWLDSLVGKAGNGLRILGSFPDTALLPTTGNQPGDSYIVDFVMWVWEGTKWEPVGQSGPSGTSAYQIAVQNGFSGSIAQWLESLIGDSAYRVAVDNGFVGSRSEWLASLRGESAFAVAVNEGFAGTRLEWLESLIGPQGDQGIQGIQGEQGIPSAAIVVLGSVDTQGELPTAGNTPGDAYFIGQNLWVWTDTAWFDAGQVKGDQGLQGIQGVPGDTGERGISAYEHALTEGFSGTLVEWLDSLVGDTGLSAYEFAVQEGFVGSAVQWLASLQGDDGLSAFEIAVQTGFTGTSAEWLATLKGDKGDIGNQGPKGDGLRIDGIAGSVATLPPGVEEGKAYIVGQRVYFYLGGEWVEGGELVGPSAYEVAVANGFVGTEAEWLTSIVGRDVYDIAVENGFVGTPAEWLASLVGPQGEQGIQGEQGLPSAAVKVLGTVTSEAELPTVDNAAGDAYFIGQNLWAFDGTAWFDAGVIEGPQGEQGVQGVIGKSIYDIAVEQGFAGSEADFITSLEGKSAYLVAVENGFTGSEAVWLESIKGTQGDSAYAVAVRQGFTGTRDEWLLTLQGERGMTPYEFAVDRGFTGTEAEWFDSLEGVQGVDGPSAYEVAVAGGYTGTEVEWLASLKGDKGDNAIAVDIQGELTTIGELPATGAFQGEAYLIAGDVHVWVASQSLWLNVGPLVGPQGEQGVQGIQGEVGLSAYEQAVDLGFIGTFEDWVDTLIGPSAYEGAVENGFVGTFGEWEESLRGPEGKSPYQLYIEANPDYEGDVQDWLQSLNGNRWISLNQDPTQVVGNVGDYFINTVTNQWFQKVNETTWAPIGYLGGGTVYEAPMDGAQYVRVNGEWVLPTAEVPEAPNDGALYGRQGEAWVPVVAEVPEAPADGEQYVRKDLGWAVLTPKVDEVVVGVGEENKEFLRRQGAWQEVTDATVDEVKVGTNVNAKMSAASMALLFESMGIYWDETLGEWVNDESLPAAAP